MLFSYLVAHNDRNLLLASSLAKALTSQLQESLLVLVGGRLADVLGESNTLLALNTLLDQPVTDELLVEAVLVSTDLVRVLTPESRRVGGENLIDKVDVALAVLAKLELGVGNDDATLSGVLGGGVVDLECQLVNLVGKLLVSNLLPGVIRVDVLVMLTSRCLGARRVDGLGELLGHLHASGHRNTVDGTLGLVLLVGTASQVAANNSLDRDDLKFADKHAAVLELLGLICRDRGGEIKADKVSLEVGNTLGQDFKPVGRGESQNGALVGDTILHDYIKGRDSVRGHKEQVVGVRDLEEITNLAGGNLLHRRQVNCCESHFDWFVVLGNKCETC